MRKIKYIILMVVLVIVSSGCSNSSDKENLGLKQEMERITEENKALLDKVRILEQDNKVLNEEISSLQDEIKEVGQSLVLGEGEQFLSLYGANIDTYAPEVIAKIIIQDNLSLGEKLDIVANNLSKYKFKGLGIQVSQIEEKDDKKIATINLTEKQNKENASWNTGYFQGSTGGIITSTSLITTFLQEEYDGEWIDGVEFLYNGAVINSDHVGALTGVNYR